jgi:DNA-binding FadR family transcriptional regulator
MARRYTYESPKLNAVAELIGVSPELLRDVLLEKGGWISVRNPKHTHVFIDPSSVLSRVSRELHIEPEMLRDAIVTVCDVPLGGSARLGVRRSRALND